MDFRSAHGLMEGRSRGRRAERDVQVRRRMKIAFATRDHEHVDEQFRRAPHLDVYEVTPVGARLDRRCEFPPGRPQGTDERMRAIAGSAVVFVSAIGPSLAARIAAHGFRAATAPAGTRIADLLVDLQRALGGVECRAETVG